MKHLQSHLHYTTAYEVLDDNEPIKDANTAVAISGLRDWATSLNSSAVAIDPAVEVPVNAMTSSIAEGLLFLQYEVE